MKERISLLLLMFFTLTFGQPKEIEFVNYILSPQKQVVEVEGKSAKELYDLTYNYIVNYYRSPNDVIKGKDDGKFISISGINKDIYHFTTLGQKTYVPVKYVINISFKDGKYLYEFSNLNLLYNTHEQSLLYLFDTPLELNKNGELKRAQQPIALYIPKLLNILINSHYDYLVKNDHNDW